MLIAGLLALGAAVVAGCGSEESPAGATSTASKVGATPTTTTATTGAGRTESGGSSGSTGPTGVTAASWSGVDLPPGFDGEPALVAMDGEVLLASTLDGKLYALPLAGKEWDRLPVEGWVGGFDVENGLVVWTERSEADFRSPSSLWAYPLPDGPRVPLVEEAESPHSPLLAEGRVYFVVEELVQGDPGQGETLLYELPIWSQPLDEDGRAAGEPKVVTAEPNASRGAGGDEVWSYGLAGSRVAYQRDYGDGMGIHLLDLTTGESTFMGEGSAPSLSESKLVWRGLGPAGFRVEGHDLATGTFGLLGEGHSAVAGPGYVAFVRPADPGGSGEVAVFDEGEGVVVAIGKVQETDGYYFTPIAAGEEYLAWVAEEEQGGPPVLRLATRRTER